MKRGAFTIMGLIVPVIIAGCFKEIVETREPLPAIVWPKPPEIARIRFVNSISRPEHLSIRENFSSVLLNFIKGKVKTSLVHPYGVITDSEGRLFVVDTFNRYVHVFDPEKNDHYIFPRNSALFVSPIDLAIDRNNNIYVSDSENGLIYLFRNQGKTFVKEIGSGLLNRPTGLAYNSVSEELLVADTKKSEIVRFDTETHMVKGSWGGEGEGPGALNNPTNIFVSHDGMVYVTDSLNFRIQIFTHDGQFVRTFGSAGDSPGSFARPRGVAVDSEDHIYVVDAIFDNVQIFNEQGELLMDFGGPGSGYGEFWLPSGIYIDADDKIYISDSYNKRIQVFQYMKYDK